MNKRKYIRKQRIWAVFFNERVSMIPKIIHYCWYGNKEKPVKFLKYMDTWKKIGGVQSRRME